MTPTDPPRCEPPEELRGVDGWHWVKAGDNPSECWRWSENGRYWQSTSAFSVRQASSYGYRYVAPVTAAATVAALAEALEAARGALVFVRDQFGYGAPATDEKIATALALYRGRP